MMKPKPLLALLSLLMLVQLAKAQQLPVGTQSEDVAFALLEGSLSNTQLSAFEGGIVVLYYYTPW